MRTLCFRCLVFLALAAGFVQASPPERAFVIVVGDETVQGVLQRLDDEVVRASTDLSHQARASLVIMAQDATQGPTPHHASLVNRLESRHVRRILWLFTNSSRMADPDLLALQMLEASELLERQGFAGDSVRFAFDFADAPADSPNVGPKGWEAINAYLSMLR